ncbi:MAG: DUF721 domain-containing protein [Alphaproteobacteria bacterium]|nr:DUF721 domain-containing protein [Alphaproteobacteria bacterium]
MSNQDKKINLDVRKSRPQTLASAFGGLMEIFGGRAGDADLAKNWENIVDKDISNIANVVAVKKMRNKKFNIVLRPVSPAFALELSYKLDDCKNQLNKYYGYDAVAKITIRK